MATSPPILAHDGAKSFPLPARGVVVGSIAIGLAALAARSSGGSLSWGDVAVLACLAVASLVGSGEARRLVAAREATREPAKQAEGAWMRVVVGPGGPADTAGIVAVPKAPPRNDPERRSLARRAEERRHATAASRR